mmetsp:Transcript_15945/g.33074  ORF Transcript_15945/g.33074 Transcript_15945/m.33074 type:complete len:126 (+) Transcript_15945:358-735(+)
MKRWMDLFYSSTDRLDTLSVSACDLERSVVVAAAAHQHEASPTVRCFDSPFDSIRFESLLVDSRFVLVGNFVSVVYPSIQSDIYSILFHGFLFQGLELVLLSGKRRLVHETTGRACKDRHAVGEH